MVKSKDDIKRIIAENRVPIINYGAKSIGLFGSFQNGTQTAESDIDLIIEFDSDKKNFDNFINLAYYLEELFNRRVELITPESISKYIKPHIEKSIEYVSLSI
jgi:predicted nucleotidyltransferase